MAAGRGGRAGRRRARDRPGRHRHREVRRLPGAGGPARDRPGGGPVIVATATIALQRQLVDRDLPRVADGPRSRCIGRPLAFAVLKGRNNYVCLQKLHGSVPRGRGRGAVRRADERAGPAGDRGAGVGRGDGDRRSRRVPRRRRPAGVAGLLGRPPRMRGGEPVRVRRGVLHGQAPRCWPRRPTSSSPTTRCSRSTRSRASRCSRSTTR